MSYRVDYSPEMKDRYPIYVKRSRKFPIRPLLLAVAVIVVCYGILSSGLSQALIPGDAAVTTAAFSTMVDEIGAGESVRQAFMSFCKEIIVNAG